MPPVHPAVEGLNPPYKRKLGLTGVERAATVTGMSHEHVVPADAEPVEMADLSTTAKPEVSDAVVGEAATDEPMWDLKVVPVAPKTPMLRQRCIR